MARRYSFLALRPSPTGGRGSYRIACRGRYFFSDYSLFFCNGRGLVGAATFLAASIALLLCWRLGLLGGGDVKLLAGVCLLLPPEGFVRTAFWIAVSGAILAIFYQSSSIFRRKVHLAMKCRNVNRPLAEANLCSHRNDEALPYAVAIVSGYALNCLV